MLQESLNTQLGKPVSGKGMNDYSSFYSMKEED